MARIQQEGTVTTSGSGGQFLSTGYTVPIGRVLYLKNFCVFVDVQPSGVCTLGLSGGNTNAGLAGVQTDTLRSSYPSGPIDHAVAGGTTVYVYSGNWPTLTAIGFLFEGDLI